MSEDKTEYVVEITDEMLSNEEIAITNEEIPDWAILKTEKTLPVNIKLVHPDAMVPTYAHLDDACFDLFAIEDCTVYPYDSVVIDTGVSFEIPDGYVMMVFARSSMGFKYNIRLANCTGIIDSGFRNTVKVKLIADSETTHHIQKGDRVAQAMVIPYPKVSFNVTEELSKTKRGQNGLGSTGR